MNIPIGVFFILSGIACATAGTMAVNMASRPVTWWEAHGPMIVGAIITGMGGAICLL